MMGEENQPIGDAQATPGSATSESADATSTDAAPATQESGSGGAEPNLEADSSLPDSIAMEEDDTDYEAEFMKLRATYAAKERECEALKVQADDAQNQYLRLAADFENFRRRTQEEREKLDVQVKIATLGELLSVVDNFERARAQIKPQSDAEMNIHKSYQGVYKDMVDRLKKIGVSPMRAEGKEFDPNLHEAVLREPTSEYAEGTVIDELVRGYMIGDRVLRHAMVKVAAPPEEGGDGSGAGNATD
ncbi:nucleotide exchange factor GrpE [Alkalinema sp. FACHB-956]|uniref:nucleotide exchange factor GrpE n=1 Tax=Alkalinema sp. FACHB-956 TaxID=2692768 RepID=UPI00168A09F3|nr:nucleotide exchange factor GrpE [Alkalinema sp. FACHB-956]MBD2325882.1 nucleotide exchange factor GrpE [Alkalinema sp. FACHB-956]